MVPPQSPAAHQMGMDVGDFLPGVRAAVDGQPETFVGDPLLAGHVYGRFRHFPDQIRLLIRHPAQRRDMLPRDHQ